MDRQVIRRLMRDPIFKGGLLLMLIGFGGHILTHGSTAAAPAAPPPAVQRPTAQRIEPASPPAASRSATQPPGGLLQGAPSPMPGPSAQTAGPAGSPVKQVVPLMPLPVQIDRSDSGDSFGVYRK